VVAEPVSGKAGAAVGRLERPAVAIITRGSFSSINEALLAAFRETLPSYDLDVVDVLDVMQGERRLFKGLARLYAWKEFGRLLLLRREKLHGAGGCLIRTTYYQERLRRRLRERLAQRTYVFTLQTQSLFDGSLPGVPHFVYTDHAELQCLRLPGFSPRDLFPPRWIAMETSIYRNATMVFTMSESTRRCLIDEYGCAETKVACVRAGPNVAPRDGYVPPAGRYASKRILFVGTRWQPKGGEELASAFERVLESHTDAKLTIVGCSPVLELPNCEIVGPVPVSQVGGYYDHASIFCLPTRREAYGIAFVEALAHGLPVVATRVGALGELVSDGENGYLVEVGDVDALTSRLTALLDDPEACRRFGVAARRAGESYAWSGTARTMLGHIENVCGPL
jgi:glycosyltransferase involved in cell wall biosynthesis